MAQTNYRDMEAKLANRKTFVGNSASAIIIEGTYTVISYDTVIARDTGEEIWVNPTKYSQTTSRLQGLIKKAWML